MILPNDPDGAIIGTISGDVTQGSFKYNEAINPEQDKELQRSSILYGFKSLWLETMGEGINVALIDTGIDLDHPAFVPGVGATIVEGSVHQPAERSLQDTNGHGTHCAGIIAAHPLGLDPADETRLIAYRPVRKTGYELLEAPERFSQKAQMPVASPRDVVNTGLEGFTWRPMGFNDDTHDRSFNDLSVKFTGVAPLANLMIYKVTTDEPERSGIAKLNDVALAINTAVDEGADIISISIGGDTGTDQLYAAVHRALSLRRMVITSAGNLGALRNVNIGYPGRYGGVITVGAHDRFGKPSSFTSAGGEVDLSGPGERIWSTWKDQSYASRSGTSMAAPWIAGIAALILSKHRRFSQKADDKNETPLRNNEELRRHLLLMAVHPGHYEPEDGYGALWPADYFAREAHLNRRETQ